MITMKPSAPPISEKEGRELYGYAADAATLNEALDAIYAPIEDLFDKGFYKTPKPLEARVKSTERQRWERSGSSWSMNVISFNTVNNYAPSRSEKRGRENHDVLRIVAGVAALIIGGLGAYFLGRDIAKLRLANEGLEAVDQFEEVIQNHSNHKLYSDKAQKARKFFKDVRASAIWGIALKTSIVAGAALALTGAILGALPLIAGGALLTAFSGGAYLIRLGITSGDDRKLTNLALRIYGEGLKNRGV